MSQPAKARKRRENPSQIRSPVLVALGSNQGFRDFDRIGTVRRAVELLEHKGCLLSARSPLYITPAFPKGSGPDFINAAVAIKTDKTPYELMVVLQQIERALGRERGARWGPRSLDLDLLAFGDTILPSSDVFQTWADLPLAKQMQDTPQELILPHPRLQDRAFVLAPLNDIAPEWCHPVLGVTVAQMLAALPQSARDEVKPLANPLKVF
jgi:2-amino-4-hydroxy-6-hydroxymethyldihydropteridine diphosphokinase